MDYTERIEEIAHLFADLNIDYTIQSLYDGAQLRFPWCDGDVTCHSGTYGANYGNVETMGFPWDNGDVTELSPIEFVRKLIEYYLSI